MSVSSTLNVSFKFPLFTHEHPPDIQIDNYIKTPIYRASRGKGFRPGISGGPVSRIVKYTKLHINPVFGGRGKAPVNRGTRYIGAR